MISARCLTARADGTGGRAMLSTRLRAERKAASPAMNDTSHRTFDPAAHGWEAYGDDGFIGLVGPFWTRQDGDTHRYAFLAEPKHHNRRGVVQGGMLMTFADRSMGMTA